ncbi:MAG: substrate-binding domain-containing protein [Candidatus Eisenbacteria bacterium]|nr:substrate-binding domain-containing protein [Candidatus Eisenbacteria bacterium]
MNGAPRSRGIGWFSRSRWRAALAAALLIVLAGVVWFGARSGRNGLPRTLTLYCFSGMQDVMEEGVLPAFRAFWLERTGERVEFITTFAGSGTISDRIVERFPAEVAILSSEMDAFRLAERGVVAGPTWRRQPRGGVLGRSPMVILVRPGNPSGIAGFADLARPGLALVQPDPLTSGAGEWGLLSVWTAANGAGEEAVDLFRGVRRNTAAVAPSAREARAIFLRGEGDALITYESEAIALSNRLGSDAVVRPVPTVVAEAVVIAIDKNVAAPQRSLVDGFLGFLWGEEAQSILAAGGFRAADDAVNARFPALPPVEGAVTLADLGGAATVRERILGEAWERSASPGGR